MLKPRRGPPQALGSGLAFCLSTPESNQRNLTHLWTWLDVPGRADHLVCAVLVLEYAAWAQPHRSAEAGRGGL